MDSISQVFTLDPYFHLVAYQKEYWLLFAPDDQWIKLNADFDRIANLKTILNTEFSSAIQQQAAIMEAGVAQEFKEFHQFGVLSPKDKESDSNASTVQVIFIGSHPIQSHIAQLLGSNINYRLNHFQQVKAFIQQADSTIEHNKNTRTILIHAHDYYRHDDYQQIHRWCQQNNIPWLPIYHEGKNVYIGPVFSSNTIDYFSAHQRRLACTLYSHALELYYDDISQQAQQLPLPSLRPANLSAIATALLNLLDLVNTPTALPQLVGMQFALDLPSNEIHTHTILPLPPAPHG